MIHYMSSYRKKKKIKQNYKIMTYKLGYIVVHVVVLILLIAGSGYCGGFPCVNVCNGDGLDPERRISH